MPWCEFSAWVEELGRRRAEERRAVEAQRSAQERQRQLEEFKRTYGVA